jgi:hypothetical protein
VQIVRLTLDVRVGRLVQGAMAGIVAFVVVAAIAADARGAARASAGWRAERNELVWVSETPLRMGDARYEFRSGDQLLGYPVQRGKTLGLPVARSVSLGDLSVWAGGRRIDRSVRQQRIPTGADIGEPEIARATADPAARGPYRAQRFRYRLAGLAVEGYPAPLEVVGEVTVPAGPFDLRAGCTPNLLFEVLPHWLPMSFAETAPAPRALRVTWQQAGGAVQIPVSRSLSGADALDFRIAGEPGAPRVEMSVRVGDALGGWAELATRPIALRPFSGQSPLGKVEARQLRASLRDATTVDLSNIT